MFNRKLFHRGVLTGKFTRDKSPEATGSRIGFIHQDESKAMQAAPAWTKYKDDESYWNLLSVVKDIAQKHGQFSYIFYVFCFKKCTFPLSFCYSY